MENTQYHDVSLTRAAADESGLLIRTESEEGRKVFDEIESEKYRPPTKKETMEKLGFMVLKRKDGFPELTDNKLGEQAWYERRNKIMYCVERVYEPFTPMTLTPGRFRGKELELWGHTFRIKKFKIPPKSDLESLANAKGKALSSYVAVAYQFTITVRSDEGPAPTYTDYATMLGGPYATITEINHVLNSVQYYLNEVADRINFGKSNRGLVPVTRNMLLNKTNYRKFRKGEDTDRRLYVNMITIALKTDGTFVSYRNTFGDYRYYNRVVKEKDTGKWRLALKSDQKKKRGRPKKATITNVLNVTTNANAVTNVDSGKTSTDTNITESTKEANQSVS